MVKERSLYTALTLMEKAEGPVTPEYLATRLKIPDYYAYNILIKLVEQGLVTRRTSSDWSKSLNPKFEISLKGRSKITSITEKISEVIAEML